MVTILRGKMSVFGGPKDKGVEPNEGLALINASNIGVVQEYFLTEQPSGTSGLARKLNPDSFYLACRWNYHDTPRDFLVNSLVEVRNLQTGVMERAKPVDWGPNASTGRVADLSPGLANALNLNTDDLVEVTIPAEHEALQAAGEE